MTLEDFVGDAIILKLHQFMFLLMNYNWCFASNDLKNTEIKINLKTGKTIKSLKNRRISESLYLMSVYCFAIIIYFDYEIDMYGLQKKSNRNKN